MQSKFIRAEQEAIERGIEHTSRFLPALNSLEQSAAQARIHGRSEYGSVILPSEIKDEREVCLSAIMDNYDGVAQFLQRLDIDAGLLLTWVQTKMAGAIPKVRALIQQALIKVQIRREQLSQHNEELLYARTVEEAVGGSEPAEGEKAEGIDERTRRATIAKLEPAVRKAYFSYQTALLMAEKREMQDWEDYQLLKEQGIPEGSQGEMVDYQPPVKDTWSRYLREARETLSEQKNAPAEGDSMAAAASGKTESSSRTTTMSR